MNSVDNYSVILLNLNSGEYIKCWIMLEDPALGNPNTTIDES